MILQQNSTDVRVNYFYDEDNVIQPIDVLYERHIVNPNGLIQLKNIPSPLHTVFTIIRRNGTNVIQYNKVESVVNQYDFMVDYINGILTFHSSQVGKEIQISYTNSIGKLNISADIIFTNIDNQGNIVQTLGTMIDEGRSVLSDLSVLGGASKVITELQGYIESARELTGNIIQGSNINTELKKSTDTAKSTNTTLSSTITNANNKISDLNSWVESHGDIINLDNRVGTAEDKLNTVSALLETKANDTDSNRTTTNKTTTGAINELNSKKAEKTYVDIQDQDLLRQIGQGVTDTQLQNAIQTKIDDGSIASLSVGTNSIRPINLNNGVKEVKPLIWAINNNSVIKSATSITIGTNVGIIYRNTFVYVNQGTYTFDNTDRYLVLRGITLGEGGSVTPILVGRTVINEDDIIIAYRSGQIWTIWDSLMSDYISTQNKNTLSVAFTTTQRTPLGGFATITSRIPFNIDTENKVINFDTETYINYNGKFIKLSVNTVDITNALNGGWLWYDVTNNKVIDTKPSSGENYIYLGTLWINPIIVNINNECGFTLNGMPYNYQNGKWINKTINCIGDSITEGVGTSKPYHQWLSQLCGFKTVINNGIGATYFAEKSGDPWGKNTQAFCNRIKTIDITGDVILFAGLTNDFGIGNVIGNINDTTKSTVCGAMKIAFDNAISRNPNAKIVLALPIQRNDMVTNSLGLKLEDYINAGKEVAKMYSIPIINGYENSGITIKNIDSSTGKMRYTGDNLHPNDEGHKKLALLYSGVLNSI